MSEPSPLCVASQLSALLPNGVRIGRYEVPVKAIAKVFLTAVEYAPLARDWRALNGERSAGAITIVYTPG